LLFVAFEVLTAVTMKSSILWDVMLCSPLKVERPLEEHATSIFKDVEYAKHEAGMKQI
jgi:hypothetical protein